MGRMTLYMIKALIKQKGWKPYIKGHWMDLGRGRGGVIITFKEHEQFEYQCSHSTAKQILSYKGV